MLAHDLTEADITNKRPRPRPENEVVVDFPWGSSVRFTFTAA